MGVLTSPPPWLNCPAWAPGLCPAWAPGGAGPRGSDPPGPPAGRVAQVFDVAQCCLRWQWTFAHPLEFWAWLEPETLALVTEEEVFHWALSRPKPRRQFRRHERLWRTEVVGYQRDASRLWLALSTLGLDQKGQVVGLTQLHWRGGRLSQVIEAQAVGLPRHSFSRNPHPSSALLAAVRHGTERNGQFHVVELGPHQPGNAALLSARASLAFKGAQPGDFPSAVQFAPRLGLALVLTKHALLFLADVETAQPLHRVQLAWDIVFATVPDPPRHGLVGVCRSGKVLSVSLCPDPLLQLLSRRPASLYLTQRLLQLVGRAPGLCKVSPPAEPAMPRGQPRLQAGGLGSRCWQGGSVNSVTCTVQGWEVSGTELRKQGPA
ncbi:clathrin heavy chain 2-like [Natator depressus]|uniref:clathrin heavy chain 2-like n=1 Tax=Natator depressus TaxID=27790 RepID=UPI003EB75A80